MKKIFLALFVLVFCAYSQNDSDKSANSSADELKEAYKLSQIGCDISKDLSCVFYSQALLFGIFEDKNTNKALKNSCQNGAAMS